MEMQLIHYFTDSSDEHCANGAMNSMLLERFLLNGNADLYNQVTGNHGKIYVRVPDFLHYNTYTLCHGYPLWEITKE